MRKVWDWLGNFNNLASILLLLGVPLSALGSLAAAFWAYVQHLRISYIVIILFVVFGSILWSWIGLIWLFDRAKTAKLPSSNEKPEIDCAWGLIVDGCLMGFDTPDKPIGCQITVQIRNRLNWPIRYELVSWKVEIDHKTPDIKLPAPIPGILMPDQPHGLNLDGFKHGKIDPTQRLSGTIEIVIRYGHPDGNYSRIMSRWMNFDLFLTPQPLFPGFLQNGQPLPPIIGKIPLQTGFIRQDEDIPYIPPKSINPSA